MTHLLKSLNYTPSNGHAKALTTSLCQGFHRLHPQIKNFLRNLKGKKTEGIILAIFSNVPEKIPHHVREDGL